MKKNYEKILPTYICDIQEINNLSKVMFMNNFPHHQFILCTSGTGKICTENNIEQTVSKGDIVFINSSILTPEDFIAESGFDFIKQNISSINIDFSPYLKLHKISITELNDIFISRYGKNIDELIYFYRMEFAKYAVFKVGNTHYERYYNQCGFKSPEEFYSEFKKYANMTVEEYFNLVWAK